MSLGEMTPGKLRILKAVATLLEDPSAKVTISQIAKTVHVTEAAIYRHYKSKEEIFVALLAYMETNFLGPINAAQQEREGTSERLEYVFDKYIEFLDGHPGLARLFLGHGATEATGMAERIKILHAKIRAQVAQILRYGQAQREMSNGVEPEQATEMFYGMLVAASMAQAFGFPQVSAQSRWNAFRDTMLAVEAKAA